MRIEKKSCKQAIDWFGVCVVMPFIIISFISRTELGIMCKKEAIDQIFDYTALAIALTLYLTLTIVDLGVEQ